MSRSQSKQQKQAPQPPAARARRIEKLKQQVRKFEEKGYTDTPHHQELATLLGTPPVENADNGGMEVTEDGE